MYKGHKIAFELSGGKDSIAALYFLRPMWDLMTVYWLDTGDAVPEVREVVQQIALELPNFKVIQGRQPENVKLHGWPTDLLSADSTAFGAISLGDYGPVMQGRNECCYNSLMLPMHEAVLADGNTVIVRGQKLSDKRKSTIRSGDCYGGIHYWFPIEDWSDDDVLKFLESRGIPLPSYYDLLKSSPDCLTCTAYWDENRKRFLQERHPEAWQTVSFRLGVIRQKAAEATAQLNKFLED